MYVPGFRKKINKVKKKNGFTECFYRDVCTVVHTNNNNEKREQIGLFRTDLHEILRSVYR